MKSHLLRNESGLTLIETLLASAIAATLLLGSVYLFLNQQKQQNNSIFQSEKEQLRLDLISSFLRDKRNCECLFKNASLFPVGGINKLVSTPPTAIGKFVFPNPSSSCNDATMHAPMITKDGTGSMKLLAVELKNIRRATRAYVGSFEVIVESLKEVGGQRIKGIRIPVGVEVESLTNSSNVRFKGCSMDITFSTPLAPTTYSLTIRRDNRPYSKSTAPFAYTFCAITYINTGSENGGPIDHCKIRRNDDSTWTISGRRQQNSDVRCDMACFE